MDPVLGGLALGEACGGQQESLVLEARVWTCVVKSAIESRPAALFAGVGASIAAPTVLLSSAPDVLTASISFWNSESSTLFRSVSAVLTVANEASTAAVEDLLRGVWLICVTAELRESETLQMSETGSPPEPQPTRNVAAAVVQAARRQGRPDFNMSPLS